MTKRVTRDSPVRRFTITNRVPRKRISSEIGQPHPVNESVSRGTPRPPQDTEPRAIGLPIAWKFAIFIALLVIVFMSWQTAVSIKTALPRMDEQINAGGLELVVSVATLLSSRGLFHESSDLNFALENIIGTEGVERVLNVVVYDNQGDPVATAHREQAFNRSESRQIHSAAADAAHVEIEEFTYEGKDVRSFARTVYVQEEAARGGRTFGMDMKPLGSVEVYISAEQIDDAQRDLTKALITVSVCACLVGAAGAFLLARFLTRPIRILAGDLRHVSHGNLDHQSHVNSRDELGELAHTFNVMTKNLRQAEAVKLAQKTLEHELSLATDIQTRLLPESIPELAGFDIAAYYDSAKEVGGDYYDFIPIPPHHMGLAIADVSGKGIPAALVMTMTRSLLRLASENETVPTETVESLNRFLAPDLKPGMFVTLVYLVLDLRSHSAQLVRCGHNPPYLFTSEDDELTPITTKGIGVGLDKTGELFASATKPFRFGFSSGDILVCYTDGVVEAKNRAGMNYGEERFEKIIREQTTSTAREIVKTILDDVEKHRGSAEPSDDITLLVVKKR